VRFLLHHPETSGTAADMLDPGHPVEVAVRAEEVGFDGYGLTEHPVPGARWLENGGHQSLDPFVALGAVGAATSRIRLITNIVVAPYRNPFLLAKAAATVDKLSGGRMTLGLGSGYLKGEFHALGVDFDERGALFDELLEVLPLHWSGEAFSFEGRHFSARDVVALPRPVQDPIPVWIGGNSAAARRRVVSGGAQGWMPMMVSAQVSATARTRHIGSLAELADLVAEVRAAADRPLDVMVSYHPEGGDVLDEPERHRDAFAEYEKAGVTWLVVSPATRTRDETFRFLDDFGGAYLG
jgi:probable F420-dependent oxidoreductase